MRLAALLLLLAGSAPAQDTVTLFNKGLALKNAGMYKEAVAAFDEVIKRSRDDGEAYNNRGALKFLLWDFEGARADYNKAVDIDGLDPKPLSNRCLLSLVEDKAQDGLLDCARSTQSAKDYFPGWNNLGYVLFEMGQFQKAQETFDKAAEMSPESAEPVLGLALAALRLNNRRDCSPLLKDAIALKPVIALGPDAYEESEGPLFASESRAAYKELLKLYPQKVPKKKKKKATPAE